MHIQSHAVCMFQLTICLITLIAVYVNSREMNAWISNYILFYMDIVTYSCNTPFVKSKRHMTLLRINRDKLNYIISQGCICILLNTLWPSNNIYDQHWPKKWLGAWWHRAITWSNVNLHSVKPCGMDQKPISLGFSRDVNRENTLQNYICNINGVSFRGKKLIWKKLHIPGIIFACHLF